MLKKSSTVLSINNHHLADPGSGKWSFFVQTYRCSGESLLEQVTRVGQGETCSNLGHHQFALCKAK
jgi:hypothetical protein